MRGHCLQLLLRCTSLRWHEWSIWHVMLKAKHLFSLVESIEKIHLWASLSATYGFFFLLDRIWRINIRRRTIGHVLMSLSSLFKHEVDWIEIFQRHEVYMLHYFPSFPTRINEKNVVGLTEFPPKIKVNINWPLIKRWEKLKLATSFRKFSY